jgi:O-antigen/teichoic acid export membrane protein
MSGRAKRFIAGLFTAYAGLLVNIAYTALSVPLALHYLGKEQFGLWALALQISGYMSLLDLGMTFAVSRFVANHKDDVNGGEYGSLLITGGLVFTCQGILIVLFGFVFALFSQMLFCIPEDLSSNFRWVLVIITTISGFSIASRSIGAPLWAFQRMDVSNVIGMITLILNFIMLWIGFRVGWGIYSLAFAGIPSALLSPIVIAIICNRNGYYPVRGSWGRPRWDLFHKVFGFGKDVLLMTLGNQMVNATQIMILSRVMGLDAAATFSIGTKCYTMGLHFVYKIMQSSTPALTEMFIRGDKWRFNERFWNVLSLTSFMATVVATALLAVNQILVSLWTSGAIQWSPWADALLAGLVIVTSLSRCFVGTFETMGSLGAVRYIYLLEGCLFVTLAIPAARYFGIIGMIGTSLISHVLVTLFSSVIISSRVIKSLSPIKNNVKKILLIMPAVLICTQWISNLHLANYLTITFQLAILLLTMGVAWHIILPKKTHSEILFKMGLSKIR